MNTQYVGYKANAFEVRNLIVLFLVVLLLTACSSQSSTTSTATATHPQPTPLPERQASTDDHTPLFLQAVEWQETRDGRLVYHDDVTFTDTAGDAQFLTLILLAGTLTPAESLPSSNAITASAQEQMDGAVLNFTWVCNSQQTVVLETRLFDRAGNSSEPLLFTFDCPAPGVNPGPYLNTGLLMAAAIILVLGLGFWLLFRRQPEERLPALMSTLLLFCLLLPVSFVGKILHEGGHALDEVFQGVSVWLYVHPFNLDGFSRPDSGSILSDFLGAAVEILAALLITLPFWKRRSRVFLPIVMLFPWAAATSGTYMLLLQGDWHNLIENAGVPPVVFVILGAVICISGYFLMFTLFPMLGLAPQSRRALFAVPAAHFLWGFLSLLVAHLVVPGSLYDVQYSIAAELIPNANAFALGTVSWAILAVIYHTLFRWIHPRLPAWLRTKTVALTWKDLRIPAVLAVISVILGLIIIT
jgi:hypothetical protein